MSRLASFQGPSTPSKSPIAPSSSPRSPEGNTPAKINRSARPRQQGGRRKNQGDPTSALNGVNPSALDDVAALIENEIHKELREILLDIRRTARSWEDLVRGHGFKAAKEMIDARTTTQNALSILPTGHILRRAVVGPQMGVIEENMVILDIMLEQLHALFDVLTSSVESLETLHIMAVNQYYSLLPSQKPASMNPDMPLFPDTTWSVARFCTVIPPLILPFYHRQIHSLRMICDELRRSDTEWERARSLLALWKEGGTSLTHAFDRDSSFVRIDGLVMEAGWSAELDEICAVEIKGWK